MSEFYLRKVRVFFRKNGRIVHTINPGDDTNDQIMVQFSISKGSSSTANTALIDIWNLAEGTRNAMGREFDAIILEAGYIPPEGGSNVGVIFIGNLRDVEHKRDGDDIITTVKCGDGDAALRRSTIEESFPAGTKVGTIVDAISKKFEAEGLSRGEVKGLDDLPAYKRPYVACGSCERELDRLSRSHGFRWSVQNETLEIWGADDHLAGRTLLTRDTGMIGAPTITDNGVRVDAFLNPQIRPGRLVQIESDTLQMNAAGGKYRVGTCTFQGNNRNGDFKVSIHAERLKPDGKVDQGVSVPIPTPRPEND